MWRCPLNGPTKNLGCQEALVAVAACNRPWGQWTYATKICMGLARPKGARELPLRRSSYAQGKNAGMRKRDECGAANADYKTPQPIKDIEGKTHKLSKKIKTNSLLVWAKLHMATHLRFLRLGRGLVRKLIKVSQKWLQNTRGLPKLPNFANTFYGRNPNIHSYPNCACTMAICTCNWICLLILVRNTVWVNLMHTNWKILSRQ